MLNLLIVEVFCIPCVVCLIFYNLLNISVEYKLPDGSYTSYNLISYGNNQYLGVIPWYVIASMGVGKYECMSIVMYDTSNNRTITADNHYPVPLPSTDLTSGDFDVKIPLPSLTLNIDKKSIFKEESINISRTLE